MTEGTKPSPLDIEGLLAFHRGVFGDARMEDEDGSDEGSSEESSEDESNEESSEGEKPKTTPEDELPDWAKGELKKTRGEAANYRVQLRAAQEALSKAKTPEEYESAVTELNSKVAELEHSILVTNVAQKYSLPAELAARLRGETEADLEKDAKSLQKFVTVTPPKDLKGGLDPTDEDDGETDPGVLARKHGRRR